MNTKFNEAQRLAERFKSVKNRSEFARTFGVPGGSSMIYQHINGIRPISPEAAKAYAKGFNCSIEEISPSVAETLKVSPDTPIGRAVITVDSNSPPSNAIRIRHVKITVQAGVDGFEISQLNPEEEKAPSFITESELMRLGCKAGDLIEITVKGDSMEPGIFAGDIVRINTAAKEPRDGKVYVLNYEGSVVIKRLFKNGSNSWIIRSDNQDKARHPDRTFTDRVFIIGTVVQKISTRI